MSKAELHTVMTNSFATLSGSTVAAYILYGVPANYLIAGSFMSAPAGLALSKLAYPDDVTTLRSSRRHALPDARETGFIEALVAGATAAIGVITHLVANLIAFICILAFMNDAIIWFGARVGLELETVTFQVICSYVFWPFVFLMGVPMAECGVVARMVGIKILFSELLALEDLGTLHKNRVTLERHLEGNGTFTWTDSGDIALSGTNVTLSGGVLTPRTETIATFALCGFSDVYAYCLLLAVLSAAAPSRKQDLVGVSGRAWICGIVACFLSACMAGFVISE
nr:hypothetical protein BaRGS_028229 [Batillaria attramentaria]